MQVAYQPSLRALRDIPYMGVIFVVAEAAKLGYTSEDPDWCNLGQGQPEVGDLPDAPARIANIPIDPADHAYAPIHGINELRDAVATLYNGWYRRGKSSQYTRRNVAITAGGRLALSRACAALGAVRLGYFVPDYSAYEDLLRSFDVATAVRIELKESDGFAISPDELDRTMVRERLGAILASNPCNPTGRTVRGPELAEWVRLARDRGSTLLLDEFYSHYVWSGPAPVSAAAFVDDVERDPVLIFDGLTKGFRYPGWRIGWTVGPSELVEMTARAGSFLDGGAARFVQRAAVDLLSLARADAETSAMRAAFRTKRDRMVERLTSMGVSFPREPEGTFYAFGSVANLPAPLNDGFAFFRAALQVKVITVPGVFFDLLPRGQKPASSKLSTFVRFSYGPPLETVDTGLRRLDEMIQSAR
jgi:aspartate/methionine/tyrosine aminotransferase